MKYNLIKRHLELKGKLIDSKDLQDIYNKGWKHTKHKIKLLILYRIITMIPNKNGYYLINERELEKYDHKTTEQTKL